MLGKLLDRPIAVTMVLLSLMVLGIVSIARLPVSLIPDVDIPYITVQATAPNLSAREIDETVSKPLRTQLVQLSSLEDMTSESLDGSCTIRLTFTHGSDMDLLFVEVNERVDRAMASLGKIARPRVFKSGASDVPAFYINLSLANPSPLSEDTDRDLFPVSEEFIQLGTFASEVVSKRIEQLPEVAMVDMSGQVSTEILIIPDTDALKSLGLSESDFEAIVSAANVRLGSLSIRDGEYRYNVRFQDFASSAEDIRRIYFTAGNRLMQVGDIAKVMEHPAGRAGLVRSDGADAVTMAVFKQADAKMSALRKDISSLTEEFGRDYPDVSFSVTRDQTELLEYSINRLAGNIIAGVLLACLVIFLFMRDLRSPGLVALTIPTGLVLSMLLFHIIGLTINIISLSGLILGVGMMVDNTIVLTDNITSRWQRGDTLRTAVTKGTTEVMGPMLSSVLTTCAVFIPLIFVSGIAGAMFYDQAMAVTAVLLSAYLVTVTVIPVYYLQWYKGLPSFRPNRFLEKFSFSSVTTVYDKGMKWLLEHLWAGWAVMAAAVLAIFACFSGMPKERLPEISYADTILHVDWNDRISLEENERRTTLLEELAGTLAVQKTSMVGTQQFVLGHSGEQSVSETSLYLKCDAPEDLAKMKKQLSEYLDESFPMSVHSFSNSGNVFELAFASDEAELVARLRPENPDGMNVPRLLTAVEGLRAALPEMEIPEVPLKTDILYVADPQLMALYDVSYTDLVSVLKNALNGNELFSIVQGDSDIPVVMGTDTRGIAEVLEGSSVKKDGYEVPLGALMRETYDLDLRRITSGAEGSYYPVEISLDGADAERTMDSVRESLTKDGNFGVGFSGAWFSNRQMTKDMTIVLLIAVILLYLILACQFESLVQPVIILSELVVDIGFALAALWMLGVSINLMSLIGLVVVCGIVVNDSILKTDTINKLRKEGLPLTQAIMIAGQRRLKAIVMTSLTTILSVSPFLTRGSMGDDLQFPMSVVIIVGMAIGTLVSIYLVPMLYYAIYRRREAR